MSRVIVFEIRYVQILMDNKISVIQKNSRTCLSSGHLTTCATEDKTVWKSKEGIFFCVWDHYKIFREDKFPRIRQKSPNLNRSKMIYLLAERSKQIRRMSWRLKKLLYWWKWLLSSCMQWSSKQILKRKAFIFLKQK